jgi:hypothetical protein
MAPSLTSRTRTTSWRSTRYGPPLLAASIAAGRTFSAVPPPRSAMARAFTTLTFSPSPNPRLKAPALALTLALTLALALALTRHAHARTHARERAHPPGWRGAAAAGTLPI